jgi:hypothetical protein
MPPTIPTAEQAEWLVSVLSQYQIRLENATIAAMMAKQNTTDPEISAVYTGLIIAYGLTIQDLQAIKNTQGRSV